MPQPDTVECGKDMLFRRVCAGDCYLATYVESVGSNLRNAENEGNFRKEN